MKSSTERNGMVDQDDPVLAFLAQAPVDDEPVTAEDERAVSEGWEDYRHGNIVIADNAKRQTLAQAREKQSTPA
jgi:hypothetical protein